MKTINTRVGTMRLVILFFLMSVFSANAEGKTQRSAWLFEITRKVGEETHTIQQYLRGKPKELVEYKRVGPILRKFVSKMMIGDTLRVDAYTGIKVGSSGSRSFLLEVQLTVKGYILVRGNKVYEGSNIVSASDIERHLSDLLKKGVETMQAHERMYDRMEKENKKGAEQAGTANPTPAQQSKSKQ